MNQTEKKTLQGQIIGGIFCDREKADEAVKAFEDMKIPSENVQLVVQLNEEPAADVYTNLLSERGLSESQARYFDQLIRAGKILVAVHELTDPAQVIETFDQYGAEYNCRRSRDLRKDVVGKTIGAFFGVAALGAIGTALAGRIGSPVGAVNGAVTGRGSGAVVGNAPKMTND